MKKVIVTMSLLVLALSLFAGCDSKGKKCGQFYDKLVSCNKEMKEFLGSKDDFVKKCKEEKGKDAEEGFKCLEKKDCVAFNKCLEGAMDKEEAKEEVKEEKKEEVKEEKKEEVKEEAKEEEKKEEAKEEAKEEEKKDE